MIKKEFNMIGPKIEEYEEICNRCNGWGGIQTSVDSEDLCSICKGRGSVNWIDKIKLKIK